MKKESSSPETCLVFVPIEFDLATFKTDEIVPDEKFGKEQLIQFFQTPFTVVTCRSAEHCDESIDLIVGKFDLGDLGLNGAIFCGECVCVLIC